jgi:hypothetical protein
MGASPQQFAGPAERGRIERSVPVGGSAEERGGWLVAIAFWCCLVGSAGLYAVVALAPAFLSSVRLRSDHHDHQARLVALEREVEELALIGAALSNEPSYAVELARVDFRAAVPAEEAIPVDPPLQLNGSSAGSAGQEPRAMAWYTPVVEPFATDVRVRRGTLAAAAVLAVFAFGFLHDGHTEQAQAAARELRRTAARMAARYRRAG